MNLKSLLSRNKEHKDTNESTPQEPTPIPVLDFVAEIGISEFPEHPPTLNLLPVNFMKKFRFLPLDDTGDSVFVVMADPFDFNTREIIQSAYGKPLDVHRGSQETIAQFIYRWYEAEVDMTDRESFDDTDFSVEDQLWDDPEHLKDMASEAPVIRLVNHLISKAFSLGASDIHIEPRKHQLQVRYRIDGVLHDRESITNKLKAAITSRLKLMAKMDIAEMRLPQDGRIKFKMGREEMDLRVSSLPTHRGESLVLRLLYKEDVQLDLDNLGFPAGIIAQFKKTIAMPYGMVLVTGPTGSGKTTTLYAALNTINTPNKKIVTVEDPIEYQLDGISQIQVQPKINLTFASCLRSFLRHDPDVMLIGEIRDGETAEIAVRAALTGHMVFSTLHTNDAAGAIGRLEDMGVERFMIATSLVAVLAQRLVRKVCPSCQDEVLVSDEERTLLARNFEIPDQLVGHSFKRGKGCEACGGTGYRGRVGIFEFLSIDETIRKEIVRGSESGEIFRKAVDQGMISLRMDGLDKVRQGTTTYEEVLRVTRL